MKKQSLALFLALALALSLAACTGKEKSPYAGAEMGDTLQVGGIDWYVIRVEEGRALLLTAQIVELRTYHHERADLTWEISDMRAYLNGEFYEKAFSGEEKKWIAETEVSNETPADYKTDCGNDTLDRLFLLSTREAEDYFADNAARRTTDPETGKNVSWWLRDPGKLSSKAACYVGDYGNYSTGGFSVTNTDLGARPAMWVIL